MIDERAQWDKYERLYHQALDEIETEMGGYNNVADWAELYRKARVRHNELLDLHQVDIILNEIGVSQFPMWMEDRETQIASGWEVYRYANS